MLGDWDVGTGTWGLGRGDWDSVTWDSETWNLEMWDLETWDLETWDSGTWTRGPEKSSIAAHDVFNSFKPPCVETILYSEFSPSNRQENISGRTMDAENYRLLLLTSSPAYCSFRKTTENYTLQSQRKCQVLFVYHVPESTRVPSPRVPASPRPRP